LASKIVLYAKEKAKYGLLKENVVFQINAKFAMEQNI
jgi:hypothetical protein